MNKITSAVAFLALTLVSSADPEAVHFHAAKGKGKGKRKILGKYHEPATKKCEELCKVDAGMDADPTDCLTECAVSTDLHSHHLSDGLDYFVTDEAKNEKGGNKMRDLYNEKATEEVTKCVPFKGFEAGSGVDFDKLDTNGDGKISESEAETFGEKACISDEMVLQLFHEADVNYDKSISKDEFEDAGEDTVNEKAMDDALEKVSEGDDESNTVQNPPMVEFDDNKDGSLDKDEATDMVEHELARRTEHADVPEETMKEVQPEIDEVIDKVDTNDDGVISGDEYVAEDKDSDSDLGKELEEAQTADEDKPEIDDLSRVDGKAAGLISQRTMLRRGHKGFQGRAFRQRE